MLRFKAWRAFLCLAFIFLTGCTPPLHKQQSYVFGTLVEITVYGEATEKAQQVSNHVLRDFDALHQTLHAWQPSALEQINNALAKASAAKPAHINVPPTLTPLLQDARRLSILAEGLFDPAIGNLVRLWGFHADSFEPQRPQATEISRLVNARASMTALHLDGDTLHSTNPALRLDLGGYAKGYALDRAAAYLKSQQVDNALINIGGNILALGSKGGQPWKVGIQHPRRAGALAMLALQDGEAIGTSGDYQRYFELDGKRYCHLIDPRSGWPANQAQAVTVIARGKHAGTLSDVASKPLFIAGPDDWRRLAEKMGIVEALFIDANGNISTTPSMAKRLIWPTPE